MYTIEISIDLQEVEKVKLLILGVVIILGLVAYFSLKSLGNGDGSESSKSQGCGCNCATCSEGCGNTKKQKS